MKGKISVLLVLIGFIAYQIFYIPSVKEVRPVEGHLRVVSYNLRYGSSDYEEWLNRKDLLIEQILTYSPDSIGIQEGDSLWMSEEGMGLLQGYDYVGVARDDGESSGEYAAIFYESDLYNVVDSGNFWLSETPDQVSLGWDAVCNRICTWVTLENKETGQIYTHMNTHLDHKGEIARRESVILLLSYIESFDTPLVLTGDFNFFQGSKNYDAMTEVLLDSKYQAQDSMSHGTMNWFLKVNFKWLKPIDFCFVTSDVDVLSYRVDNSYRINNRPVSDHYPVIVDFAIQ